MMANIPCLCDLCLPRWEDLDAGLWQAPPPIEDDAAMLSAPALFSPSISPSIRASFAARDDKFILNRSLAGSLG